MDGVSFFRVSFSILKYTAFRQQYVPNGPGLYRIVADDRIRYVGKANNLRRRYGEHLNEKFNMVLKAMIEEADKLCFQYTLIYDKAQLRRLEIEHIQRNVDTVMGIQTQHTA